jgi:acyl dehydratase
MPVTRTTLGALAQRIGQELVVSDWVPISQRLIDRFAELIDDQQWIHVDPLRAAAESPFETTVAHGFLVVSLMSQMLRNGLEVLDADMIINYGLNRLRFMAPVHAGALIRGRFAVQAVAPRADGVLVTWHVTIDRKHLEKPCGTAEWLVLYKKPGSSETQ